MKSPFIFVTLVSAVFCKCFDKKPDFYHKRLMYHNSQRLPITLESSNRVSHQITNHILKILLQEVVGYIDIEIRNENSINATEILNRITGCPVEECKQWSMDSVPETMVSLEAWMVAGFDKAPWIGTGRLVDCGPLGPYGRMGWFMPSYTVKDFWKNNIIVDHWRALKLPEIVEKFSMLHELERFNLCQDEDCQKMIFRGPSCKMMASNKSSCATLFSSFPDLSSEVLKEQVNHLELPVDVVWLKDDLLSFIKNQTISQSPVLFFNWHPNVLTARGDFTRIKFPLCRTDPQQLPYNCDFDVNQLSKVVWYKIKTNAPKAFHVIEEMTFTQEEYEGLLSLYNANLGNTAEEIACCWVKDNEEKWKHWIPKDLTNKTKIYLGGLFPISGSYWTQPGLVQGAYLALEKVNQDTKTLPEHSLNLIVSDTQCIADEAMKAFIKFITDSSTQLAGILGPGCSDATEPIAALTKHFNMVMVSYGAEAASLSNRVKYPYFFRTIPQVSHHRFVYGKFFKAMGWNHVGAIAEGGQEFPEYHIQLQEYLQKEGISVVVKRQIMPEGGHFDISEVFADFRAQNVKIIIADFYVFAARAIMCEAYRQRMTAHEGYVWFLPSWYSSDWWDVDFYNSPPSPNDRRPQEFVPCTTEQMEYAIDGHFIMSKAFTDSDETVAAGGITVREYRDTYDDMVGKADVEESHFASFVYDAVWVYAYGLDKVLKQNPGALESLHSKSTTEALIAAINQTSFQGVSGYIRFDGSDRLGNVNIMQFFHNESTRQVGRYVPEGKNHGGSLNYNEAKISWLTPGGVRPDDGHGASKSCSIESFRSFLGVTCEMSIIIANVMGFVAFIIVTIICLVLIKCRYDTKVRATHARMKELGLLSSDFSQCLSLDEWEMPRECVVLNRKLGQGAFGTVYGGEALIENEWVAIAVKTLKIGSIVEEKLDFFSEAEVMKRFKHPNIVQLLGVCTRGEPVYAVMEYLLHGDLKTYLLSRRNLVGLDMKEAEDVSPQNLTQMALNVASGLKYLHDLKYVHRDLACRNCLIHANKTVKIADFGMTRHTFDSDYYRFTRKGMLPVRWMSPESLTDGLFTSKSDVWSFGVLVYEIVTFGSFPYQGLSNNQVLDYVKMGNRLMLPDKCSGVLQEFIYKCMSYCANDRPDLVDILNYLDTNSEFLAPCIDAPMTSVVLEDTDSLEMALPSCQNTITHSTPMAFLHRRIGSSQEKLGGTRKLSKELFKFTPLRQAKTYLTSGGDSFRRNSIGTPQTVQRNSLTFGPTFDIQRSSSYHRQFPQFASSERGDKDNSSDYFSDTSKEMCQTITSL